MGESQHTSYPRKHKANRQAMQFISVVALTICAIASQVMASNVAFNVAPQGTACGAGTTISCTLSSGQSCKGNFSPKQASVVVTQAHGNCHVSLYPDNDQQGGVIQRLDTDTTGTCVFTSVAEYQSYGIFCS